MESASWPGPLAQYESASRPGPPRQPSQYRPKILHHRRPPRPLPARPAHRPGNASAHRSAVDGPSPSPSRRARRRGAGELACKPDSVPWRRAATRRRSSISACRRRQAPAAYPQASGGPPSNACAAHRGARLLALLRVGFTKPSRSPGTLVVSYTTVSPLPHSREAVCFLWHYPAGHPGLSLATTLP